MFRYRCRNAKNLLLMRNIRRWYTSAGNDENLPSAQEPPLAGVSSPTLWRNGGVLGEGMLGNPRVAATTPQEVEETFRCSVLARTVSNLKLRRYLQKLEPKDHTLVLAALRGAQAGGLRLDTKTNEVALSKLMDGGQLQASMEIYRKMIQNRMNPTANTYATLMHMCIERDMPEACQKLFEEMVKRGQSPNTRNYEMYIGSLAMDNPPKWKKAIEVFDRMSRERHGKHLTAATYESLMRVYLNMTPFDWRVVYNCYYEMRSRRPQIQLRWETYHLVAEALRRGQAGYTRRLITYLDAWFCITYFRSWEFFMGFMFYICLMFLIKGLISWVVVWYYGRAVNASRGASESVIL
ncbi:hypothetical protein, conserved [Trypanosoma brucei gambiense DAL972]|uniref:Uncharacterized protein n=2 Tax=Trypanosoma brucei TaxID=5691 RepID=C9ZS21_TRYB9|nr:hypothetical protein, conserved [Trypanosoma brucei gambiense DAL972]RHW71545.1 PPR repeat family [Trypanosoma brucei equiperdum]CBH12157.1 hypothetical protein, conserved [Trypanosoma brucei gambiense DAL972]|eukprot:XP_011774440.1 hypothetical protein, conserved [Trypanosoma brucei gambiense DAL972]